MTDKFYVWLDGRSIVIEQLDTASYLSATIRFNSLTKHVVTFYRIFTDIGWQEKHTAFYKFNVHSPCIIIIF